jgi:hypothetical protein
MGDDIFNPAPPFDQVAKDTALADKAAAALEREQKKSQRKMFQREAYLSAESEIAKLGGLEAVRRMCLGDRIIVTRLIKGTYPLRGTSADSPYRRFIYGREFRRLVNEEPGTIPPIPKKERLPFPEAKKRGLEVF